MEIYCTTFVNPKCIPIKTKNLLLFAAKTLRVFVSSSQFTDIFFDKDKMMMVKEGEDDEGVLGYKVRSSGAVRGLIPER